MQWITLPFTARYSVLTLMIVLTAVLATWLTLSPELVNYLVVPLGIAGFLALLGIYDVIQTRHSILRNYPISAHMRFLFEDIRPELRQYFFESEKDGMPFPRDKRAVVYQRAKHMLDKRPFGTQFDVYETRYEWLTHSMTPGLATPANFRINIGGPECQQPYSASILNISAMSYGALSANAIRALNAGAKLGEFAHDTGEGSVTPYHRENGGDLIWELGSGYFGCRTLDGKFDPEKFAAAAADPQIKMIEIKLSQGAKPGHGGVLPGPKVSEEIARIRGVVPGVDCVSPPSHNAFGTPRELVAFISQLRTLSGGKPVGFKLCIGHPWEFMAILKACLEANSTPDFIVVDGSEGGTGAAPIEFMDNLGMPLRDGLAFVVAALTGAGLRDRVKVGASGKIITAFDMARAMAAGADWCNSARGFMFAIGCIQAQSCHTDRCPTGVATQDPTRQRALVVSQKSLRVASFHGETMKALAELVAAVGLSHPRDLQPYHVIHRAAPDRTVTLAELYPALEPGELLSGTRHRLYRAAWEAASAASFEPADIKAFTQAISHHRFAH